jgi:hypothetical protein
MIRLSVLTLLAFVILGSNPLHPFRHHDLMLSAYASGAEKESKDKKEEKKADHKENADDMDEPEKEGGDDAEAMKNAVYYVELDPLNLPVVDKNGISQSISIVIGIEVFKESQIERVKESQPRLSDLYLRKMYGMFSNQQTESNPTMLVNPVEVKDTLRALTTEIMGEDVIKDVLIQVISQRPV